MITVIMLILRGQYLNTLYGVFSYTLFYMILIKIKVHIFLLDLLFRPLKHK